ncbi:hypothetical protein SPBR_09123 [Sporothrix brasiliensis 5110]|uniref:Uncharacterized protein n=1 Tax=Sporothrix brasiliensis 5110 TaxID=1398154 RepID=A0A0C2IUU8_9PEZI|nr:uncharacterized protein SPBR_09123 [Sporothrix brasiliensis 5110]KIH92931.1 hypothetical protein SPBR_09123 [Sporothrix brasiliensis 5110]
MAPNPRTAALNAAPGLAAAPSSTMPPNPEPAEETTSQRILKNLFYLLSFTIPNHRLDFTNREIERGEWLRRLNEVQKEILEAEKAFIEVVPALAQSTVYCCTPMTFEKQAQMIIDAAKESGVVFQNHIAYINDMLVAQAIKYISDRNGYFEAHSCRLGEHCRNKRACNGGPKFPFLPEALVTEPEQTPSTGTVHTGIAGPQTGAVASQARHTQAPPLDIQTPRWQPPNSSPRQHWAHMLYVEQLEKKGSGSLSVEVVDSTALEEFIGWLESQRSRNSTNDPVFPLRTNIDYDGNGSDAIIVQSVS